MSRGLLVKSKPLFFKRTLIS